MQKLAILGGQAVRKDYLSYGRQWIDDEDIKIVAQTLKSDFLTTGPAVENFENGVNNYVGAKYALAVSSCTAALHCALFAAGVKAGDEVLVSAITFAASANAVLYLGAKPVFVDIDAKTYNIDISKIESKITDKTKAMVAVDFSGQACDFDEIMAIAQKHNLVVVEDAAHALGSEYKGRKVGTLADITCFSFHPVKPITTGEGGMVTTNNKAFYKKMSLFRSHGITRDSDTLLDNHGDWYYEQHYLGYNYRMPDILAALGLSQLNKLDAFIARRREIVSLYNQAFADISEITTPFEADFSNSGWHIYVISLELNLLKCDRKEVFDALRKENIGVNVHYLPVYYHPYYRNLGYQKGLCPIAENLYETIITLPLFPLMSDKDVDDVIKAVKKVINYYRK